jgi:RimJ/RimL family protein N-acetyltransferase
MSFTRKEECLIISDLASTVTKAQELQIPCIAYDNPLLEKQDLFKANMLVEGFGEVDYKFLTDVYNRFYNLPITIATTNRIVIREMVVEDLDELYRLYADPEITRFLEPLYEDHEAEVEFTKAYIKNMYGFYGYGMWSLLDKKTGSLIGRAGLNNREIDSEIQIELGYMIGVPYQRQGYAYEACQEILKFAVDKLECYKVNCFIDYENVASQSLVKKLGFQYVKEVEIGLEKLSLYRWTYN